jgi:phosphatidylglycerophosphate synthase
VTVEASSRSDGTGAQRFTFEDVHRTYKRKDAWWTVLLVDPVASRLVLPIANHTRLTPNHVTAMSFAFGLASAAAFTRGDHLWLAMGALLYHVSFILDCVDGKLARLKGTGTVFGMWLDFTFDRYRVWICAAALGYGQYQRTGEVYFIWLALLIAFMDMVRYLDVFQVPKVRREMARRLRASSRDAARRRNDIGRTYVIPEGLQVRYVDYRGTRDAGYTPVPASMAADRALYAPKVSGDPDLQRSFFDRFGWWAPFRDVWIRHRMRPHLWSGIEYQMFIFIVGPLFDAVLPFTLVSASLLLLFEAGIIYKLLLSSKDFSREMARRMTPEAAATEVTEAVTAAGAQGGDDVGGVVGPDDGAAAGEVVGAPAAR